MKPYYLDSDDWLGLAEPCTAIIFTIGLFIYSVSQITKRTVLFLSGKPPPPDNPSKKKKRINTEALWSKRLALSVVFLGYVLRPLYIDKNGLSELIKGTDPKLDLLLKLAPAISRGPEPPLLLHNRHLQFAPWMIQNEFHNGDIPFQHHYFNVSGCLDKSMGDIGDARTESCNRPEDMTDEIRFDVFPPFDSASEYPQFSTSSPVILFEPGLRCHSQDMPGNMIIRLAYEKGIRSIAINRRGHILEQLLRAPRWNLFGDIDDLEQTYWHIKENLLDPNTPMFLHGISSGCAVTVTALAAWDKKRLLFPEKKIPSFVGAITVPPGYDTSKVLQPDRFKPPYNALMTFAVKDHFIMKNEKVLRAFNSEAVDAALEAETLQEFLDASAPFAGYPNASEYFKGENPVNDLQYISTPTFVLNSLDDPCCNIDNLYETSPFPNHEGRSYAQIVRDSKRGLIAVTKTGSHCPFLDGRWFPFIKDPLTGKWMLKSWADEASVEFYVAALEVYGEERRYL
ncbi:hypothetical protein TrLO_g2865 [Triparma laevis f. longispina]|uniref:Uncharacterized protein n=1 Tax=Triparma laevis f. longispina TaxID=1714387 RepID=A0A9W7C860_9STRA|nr:hypothetical protein TrLO_g2865 [Triparma laevis f. longispina]